MSWNYIKLYLNVVVFNMYKNKRVLLIAGGGTLGTYTGEELLRLGAYVDVLCPEDKLSDNIVGCRTNCSYFQIPEVCNSRFGSII